MKNVPQAHAFEHWVPSGCAAWGVELVGCSLAGESMSLGWVLIAYGFTSLLINSTTLPAACFMNLVTPGKDNRLHSIIVERLID